jgi:hypothetical protein
MMSELSGVEQEQEAPTMREAAEGPLLPRWFTVTFYVVFGIFCIYSAYSVIRSLQIQHALTDAVERISGGVGHEAAAPGTPEGDEATAVLLAHPVDSFLYLNQEILQNEDEDPRMARALALRKAARWGLTSARRKVVGDILAEMADDGSLPDGFALDEQAQQVLEGMVAERRADTELKYVEELITDVLAWVAEGHPGKAKGAEKRRLQAFEKQFEKKLFVGVEAEALTEVMAEWQTEGGTAASAAAKFPAMLAGEAVELTADETDLCTARADRWEQRYRDGMAALAVVSRMMIEEREAMPQEDQPRLDHPHVYQYLSLLNSRFPEVREQTTEGGWLLRHNRFTTMFLSTFATKTTVNPFMAVETLRLTAEEHEREMRKANERRMREAIALLARIGVDYMAHPEDYTTHRTFNIADPDEFIRKHVVAAIYEVSDEESVADVAEEALAALREADESGQYFRGVTD